VNRADDDLEELLDEFEQWRRARLVDPAQWVQGPPLAGRVLVQPSGANKPGQVGSLLDQALPWARLRGVGRWRPVALLLRTDSEARVTITVGDPDNGGGFETRTVTLTRQGLAFWCGYGHVKVRVDAVQDDDPETGTVVRWQWSRREVTDPRQWLLVETRAAGTLPIPSGARRVAAAVADPLWQWATDQDGGGDVLVPSPMPGLGAFVDVLGARSTATVANRLVWEVDPL